MVRLKLDDRRNLPLAEGKISPRGLVLASCSARACSMRSTSRSAGMRTISIPPLSAVVRFSP